MSYNLETTELNPDWLDNVRARPTEAGATPHVLVVHPERNIRELLKLHLVTAGYAATTVDDAALIGEELIRRATDLVIVDMSVPNVDGVEFFVTDPDVELIPVMFLTADEQIRARAERLGGVACLTKPLYADLFLAGVARCLKASGTARVRAGLRAPLSRGGDSCAAAAAA